MPTKLFNLQGELNWTQRDLMMVGLVDIQAAVEAYLESLLLRKLLYRLIQFRLV